MGRMKMAMVLTGTMAILAGLVPDADAANVRVRCIKRLVPPRSRISVDGNGLAAGTYMARVTSGTRSRVSAPEAAVGDEAEFDFDTNRANVAAGATKIGGAFIETEVLGEIIDAEGVAIASSTVQCEIR